MRRATEQRFATACSTEEMRSDLHVIGGCGRASAPCDERPGQTPAKWLRIALVEAGQAAGRSKNTYLSAQYHRIRGQRGPSRAAVAVRHSILVICWHLLSTGETYNDLGGDYFDRRRNSPARQRHLIAQLEALGHKVTLEPAA